MINSFIVLIVLDFKIVPSLLGWGLFIFPHYHNEWLSSVHERRDQILVTTRRGRWHSTDMNVERTKKQISQLTFLKSGACSSCFLSFNFSQFKHYPNDIQQTSAKNLLDYVRRALSLNIFSQCWMRSIWLPELSVIVSFVRNSI